MSGPMDAFFNFGPKDPVQKIRYDYYLYWVIFLAFVGLLYNYAHNFYITRSLASAMWFFIMLIISWFNFNTLKGMRQMYLASVAPSILKEEDLIKIEKVLKK